MVQVEFRWDTDMDAALLWVQEKLGLVQDQLPLEAKKPVVLRYNPFDRPVLTLGVTGALPAPDLARLVETRLKPAIERAAGVSALRVSGGLEREIRIELDAQKLNAHRLSLLQVAQALKERNVSRSAGVAAEGLFEYPVTVSGSFADVEALRAAVVNPAGGASPAEGGAAGIRLENLGAVTDGFRERASFARYDGADILSVAVYKRAEMSPGRVARNVREALDKLRRQLPRDMEVRVLDDQSRHIREGIAEVGWNALAGGLLAYGVLWLFLRDPLRALIVGLSIPMALLLTVAALYGRGMSLNLLTLGGLALGVGMLVDSSVVIMENVSRRLEAGWPLREGVLEGAAEVGGAVTFSVLTTVAAFAPIPFATLGVAQRIFAPICESVILSQMASLLVGFTLLPALMVLVLGRGNPSDRAASRPSLGSAAKTLFSGLWTEGLFQKRLRLLRQGAAVFGERARRLSADALRFYDKAFSWALRRRRRALGITALATLANGFLILFVVRRETMPEMDQPRFSVKLTLPVGTRLEATDAAARRVEQALSRIPGVAHCSVVVGAVSSEDVDALGPHQAEMTVFLADPAPRDGRKKPVPRRSARLVVRAAAPLLANLDLEGARIEYFIQGEDVFSQVFGRAGADLTVEVKGQDLEALKSAAEEAARRLKTVRGVAEARPLVAVPSLQMRYRMDQARLARDGLSVADVAESVLAAVHGVVPTKLREKGREVPLRVRLAEADRQDAAALSRLMLAGPLDRTSHPLSEYGDLEIVRGPSEIYRRDQARTVPVAVRLEGRSLSRVLPEAERALASAARGPDVRLELGEEVREMRASFRSLLWGFGAAVGLVYIVLVAQFNALWVPLLALAAVPLSVNGVAPALLLSGHSLNLMSGQGLMILAGIVVNNSLMLLEFIQSGRRAGKAPEDAAQEASRVRLRPILMTVIGNAAGLLPLALGIGRGAEMQAPMAVTVIFGLLVSTAMTLLVLPALYLEARPWFERDNRRAP